MRIASVHAGTKSNLAFFVDCPHIVEDLFHKVVHAAQFAIQCNWRAVGSEFLINVVQTVLSPLNTRDVLSDLRLIFDVHCQYFQIGLHPLEGIAAFMCDDTEHLPDCSAPLGLQRPLFRLFSVADVMQNAFEETLVAEEPVVLVPIGRRHLTSLKMR